MAQTIEYPGNEPDKRFLGAESAVTVPASGDTTIATIKVKGKSYLCFHVGVATQNLDNFDVLVTAHPSGTARDITPTNWASLAAGEWRFKYSSGNLAALAAAGNGYFEMFVEGLDEVVVKASAAADSAAVTSYWQLR